MENLLDKIAEAPVFRGCQKELLSELLSGTPHHIRRVDADGIVACLGDELHDMLILVEGTIYTEMTNNEDKELVVETLDGPLVLAPAYVYSTDNKFPVTVIAKTDCVLLYIDRNAFADLMHRDKLMMMNYIKILSERYLKLNTKVNSVALHSLRERVIAYLEEFKTIDNVAWLAKVTGVARPSLSRVLSELKSEGIIERTLDGIVLVANQKQR